MSADAMKPMLQFKIDSAVSYTVHKGRMPKDVHELREWLREFAEWEGKRADAVTEAYKEHMNTCIRPQIITY